MGKFGNSTCSRIAVYDEWGEQWLTSSTGIKWTMVACGNNNHKINDIFLRPIPINRILLNNLIISKWF
ncbi:hypothetical protein GCM10022296_06920 [Secundilactobacillus similis DSM 23365 = JCM 2765]